MDLKEYNSENTILVRKLGQPTVVINYSSGLFNFNKAACKLISLAHGDQIVIQQDREVPQNFYIEKVKTKGFVVREKHRTTSGVLFNNSTLARKVVDGMSKEVVKGKSVRILIGGTPTKLDKRTLWGLL